MLSRRSKIGNMHCSGKTLGNNNHLYPLLKKSPPYINHCNLKTLYGSRNFGECLTGTDHGTLGKLNHMKYTSQERWNYRPGELVKNNRKYPSRKARTFSDGATLLMGKSADADMN
jgi:hypothetical protein